MKKPGVWTIIFWIILALLAVTSLILGSVLSFPAWLSWLLFSAFLIPDLIWISISMVRTMTRKIKSKASFTGNEIVYRKMLRETEDAIKRYKESVRRKGILKSSAIYERPWFLLMGLPQSGKSSLLNGSGLHFPLKYPSEKDGLFVDGAVQVQWYFANEAVWIDTPGAFAEEAGSEQWQALMASLNKVRPERQIDGMGIVVDAEKVLNSTPGGIKEIARALRGRIDELIALWGIEFPVYLIFNHTDKVPGFNEYFGGEMARVQDQIFGATLSQEQQQTLPRMAFAEEFRALCSSLTDLRLNKLYKEQNEAKKRMICRFVIHFEAMQEKLSSLVTELFKPSNYEGKPIFRGFYFTSCLESGENSFQPTQKTSANMSATIANHPLNPNSVKTPLPSSASGSGVKKSLQSLFVLPLFRDIMVENKGLVKSTQKRTRSSVIRYGVITASIIVTSIFVMSLLHRKFGQSVTMLSTINNNLERLDPSPRSYLEHYKTLGVLGRIIIRLEEKNRKILSNDFGFYKGKELLKELKHAYIGRINHLIVKPTENYLESKIRRQTATYGSLSGDEHQELYRYLKAYLSMSEEINSRANELDTSFLRPLVSEALTQSLVSTLKKSRLPEQLEIIVNENIGLYLRYLSRQEAPLLQKNQPLVSKSRNRLRRLPNASNLYETLINRLRHKTPEITLNQLLNRKEEGILKSDRTISVLYTQEGWDRYVRDGITDASKDPFNLDWVIGLSKSDVPESMLDNKKLRKDMVNAYLRDFRAQWLLFIKDITYTEFGTLKRSGRLMQKLVADQSELSTVLNTVADYTVLVLENEDGMAGGNALETAGKLGIKPAKKLNKKMSKIKGSTNFSLGKRTPSDDLDLTFNALRSFARSSSGGLSGFEGYRDQIISLIEGIDAINAEGDDHCVAVFNGRESDPLLSAWTYTQNLLASMPQDLSDALKTLLMEPVEKTGNTASAMLTKSLNLRWQNEIVKPFTNRLVSYYPFRNKSEDASFKDVMDFFRPQTGTFWGFYERVLSPFILRTSTGWRVKSPGSLQLQFNPEIAQTLKNADRISETFFQESGELRAINITLTPSRSIQKTTKITVDGQEFTIAPGSRSIQFKWPLSSENPGAKLSIVTSSDFSQDIIKSGRWGFMKLLQDARISKINSSTFNATWKINVQNMYLEYIKYKIQTSGSDHPFAEPIFEKFDCPTNLMALGKEQS